MKNKKQFTEADHDAMARKECVSTLRRLAAHGIDMIVREPRIPAMVGLVYVLGEPDASGIARGRAYVAGSRNLPDGSVIRLLKDAVRHLEAEEQMEGEKVKDKEKEKRTWQ